MWKILYRNPAGPVGPPGKGDNRPEASIGESSEMAASSVCREHKSRVIEPRNIQIAGAFVSMSTGAVPERRMPSAMVGRSLRLLHQYNVLHLERAERCSSAAPPLPAFHGVRRGEGVGATALKHLFC